MPTHAQTDAAKSSLEEITVTARRTEESIQSVPVSVTAFSAEMLRESQISTPEDLQLSTPGVLLTGSGGGKNNVVYQIRGQSKALSGTSSPAVISYFAEVPDPNYGSFVPQYDMGSVQVLKGPQGTLFGRNTTGGAILYSPAVPDLGEVSGYASASFGNLNNQEYQGAVNVPLGQWAALRLAGNIHERDGYSKDLRNGSDLDAVDSEGFRVSLLVEPTDAFRNTTIFDYFSSSTDGTASVPLDVASGPTLMALLGIQSSAQAIMTAQNARGPRDVGTSLQQFDDLTKRSITNRTEFDVGSVTLINIFGYRDVDLKYRTNVDGFAPLIADGTGPYPAGTPVEFIKGSLYQYLEQTSDEFQIRGKALNDRADWLVGAFWLKNEPDGPQSNWVSFGHVVGTPQPVTSFNFVTEESKAAFAHLTYELAEGLELELGARYTEDEVESCTGIGVSDSPNGTELPACERGDVTQVVNANVVSASSNETTWSVGLNWQVTPDLFTYIVTRKGYRAGGVNAPTLSGRLTPFQSFAPETVTDGEIGLRADWQLGTVNLRTNASAFLAKYDDVQAVLTGVQVAPTCDPTSTNNPPGVSPDGDCDFTNDPAGGTLLATLGETEVKGVEFDFVIEPVEGLSFNVGGSYVDAKTTKFTPPPELQAYLGGLNGIPFNYTPETSFIGGMRYEHALGSIAEEVVFNADYYWTDDVPYVDIELPSYDVVNARLDFNGVAGSDVDVGVWVRNAFDEEYINMGNVAGSFLGLNVGLYGPPRMYGVELRYSFAPR